VYAKANGALLLGNRKLPQEERAELLEQFQR